MKLQHSLSNNVRQTKALRDAAAMDFPLGHKPDLAVFVAYANGEELPGTYYKGCAARKLVFGLRQESHPQRSGSLFSALSSRPSVIPR
jgi:hypothetical protein